MPLITQVGSKTWQARVFVIWTYFALIFLGTTMVVPFLITISGSTTNDFDYNRYRPVPRYLWSQEDRYLKTLVSYFNTFRGWNKQMRAYFPEMPGNWSTWQVIGKSTKQVDKFSEPFLKADQANKDKWKLMAADYSKFVDAYPVLDCQVSLGRLECVQFLSDHYTKLYKEKYPEQAAKMSSKELAAAALALLGKTWGIPFETFYDVRFGSLMRSPMDFQRWFPAVPEPMYQDFLSLKRAIRSGVFTPGTKSKWLAYLRKSGVKVDDPAKVFPLNSETPENIRSLWTEFKAEAAPAFPSIPFAARAAWYKFLGGEDVKNKLKLKSGEKFDIALYNKLAGTEYPLMEKTPFPIPATFNKTMRELWGFFVQERYPLRLVSIDASNPEIQSSYSKDLKKNIKHLRIANELLGEKCSSWDQFKVRKHPGFGVSPLEKNQRGVWINFVTKLPLADKKLSSSEIAYQEFLKTKYKTLELVNQTYGWNLKHWEEAFPPLAQAYTITFLNNDWNFTVTPIFSNYNVVFDFLFMNSNAVLVTFVLVALTILCTLTINPAAAYAMSRFNMRGQDKIILFMLATMAFPAMVSAIPAYLLMRDLGLLNTFFALVLPGAANGMAIFVLKGFFDSLPQELFEAATIDGAGEFQIFRMIAMPMVKPILAIKCMTAFIVAYNGWQWALIICQKKSMWTIAVWLYQATFWWPAWTISAGFVVASIPTLIVFLSCQKIILRGIVIPTMK